MSRKCHLYIGTLLPQKVSLSEFISVYRDSILRFSFPPASFFFFLLEVGSFLGGHVNLNRDRFAIGAFAGFSGDISVLARADQACLRY